MAEFCRQCAEELFPGDEFQDDFEGLTLFGDQMAGLYACVLCEDCGYIQVDYRGRCISDCGYRHDINLAIKI